MMNVKHLLPFSLLVTGLAAPASAGADGTQLAIVERGDQTRILAPDGSLLRSTRLRVSAPRLIAVPDSPIRLALWEEGSRSEESQPFYRISLDGREFSRVRQTSYEIKLVHGDFDPLVAPPVARDFALPSGGGIYIVQYVVPPLEAFRREIEEYGGTVHRFLANHAEIVEMSPEAAKTVSALPYVRWVGAYRPEYRLEPFLLEQLGSDLLPRNQRYLVQVFRSGPEQKAQVTDRIRKIGGEVLIANPEGYLLEARLDHEQLAAVAGWSEVVWIDRWFPVQYCMNNVREDGGANRLEIVTGMTGQGVAGEVLDSWLLETHLGFQSNPPLIHGSNQPGSSHGTMVSGIVFGDGTGNPAARGLLPDGKHIFSSNMAMTNRYLHTAELLLPPYEAVFQTNSWHQGSGVDYSNESTELDNILFRMDITILHAMGNTGSQDASEYAWAKNVVSVGGVNHQDTLDLPDDAWQMTGSIGPAADGRIKPDLCYWYDAILTTSDTGRYEDNFGGTSAATPQTAGHFGLFFQMWHAGLFGNTPGGATVFESRPKSSTARAMLINCASAYPFSGYLHDLNRFHQGWGRADVEKLHDRRNSFFIVDESDVLYPLQIAGYNLTVEPGETEFHATLVYLDPPGTTSSSQHRINDLSLRVIAPGGIVYWGNHGLQGGNTSVPTTLSNTVDTVENVIVPNPTPGAWRVEIHADEINQDSHLETPALDADFALVVSGIETDNCSDPTNYCTVSPNSAGPGAVMSFSGSTSVGDNDLVLRSSGVPTNQFGLFYYGASQLSIPFGNGVRCVSSGGAGIFRLPVVLSDTNGDASATLDLANPPRPEGQISLGETWYFQLWFRDPAGGGAQFNLSDGLAATFCP
jgi:serine protease AprX